MACGQKSHLSDSDSSEHGTGKEVCEIAGEGGDWEFCAPFPDSESWLEEAKLSLTRPNPGPTQSCDYGHRAPLIPKTTMLKAMSLIFPKSTIKNK